MIIKYYILYILYGLYLAGSTIDLFTPESPQNTSNALCIDLTSLGNRKFSPPSQSYDSVPIHGLLLQRIILWHMKCFIDVKKVID